MNRDPNAPRSLTAEIATRVAPYWPLKIFGTAAFITAFFFAYFFLQRAPFFPVTVIPFTALDRMIPFQPQTLWIYLSLWLYVSLPPTLFTTRAEILAYGRVTGVVAVVGLAIFLFWPTSIPPVTGIDWALYPGFGWLKGIDAAQNACPSLHVTFAVFSGIWLDRLVRTLPHAGVLRFVNAVWWIGIVYSTISTRQHVAIDAFAGLLLGVIGAAYRPRALARGELKAES